MFPRVADVVITQAGSFAARFGARLVFVYVDTDRYIVSRDSGGAVVSAPIDPDLVDDEPHGLPDELRARISSIVDGLGVQWTACVSAGDPAEALSKLADALNATAIVVGTRRPSRRSSVGEFFNGSVAVHLAHRQHRPVIVVPVAPVASNDALPWTAA